MSSTSYNCQQPVIYIGDDLGSLAINEYVLCNSLNMRMSPNYSRAMLLHRAGEISRQGVNKWEKVAPLSMSGKFCKIVLYDLSGSTPYNMFYGVLNNPTDKIYGTTVQPSGNVYNQDNFCEAFSLDKLLSRITVDGSYIYNGSEAVKVDTVFPFNGNGSELETSRHSSLVDGKHCFSYRQTDTAVWNLLQIIQYLLDHFTSGTELSWELAGDISALENITIQYNPSRKTVRDCLVDLLAPARGYTWFAYYNENTSTAQIQVRSITETAIEIDGSAIVPAAANTTSINSNVESYIWVENCTITQIEDSAYSYIEVRSEPVRVMATFKLGNDTGGLARAWTSAEEASYAGGDEKARRDEQFAHVYTRFQISDAWNMQDYNGHGLVPVVDPSTLAVSLGSENPIVPRAHAFDRELPLEAAFQDDSNTRKEYRKPFVLVKDSDGAYHISDKLSHDGSGAPNIGLRMLDSRPGIQLRPTYNHQLAKTDFSGTSDYAGLYDYTDCLLTASFYSDTILRYVTAGATVNGNERTKVVNIPGYHVWVAAPGTYYDREGSYSAVKNIRDDRLELQNLAGLVKAWHGRHRNTVSITENRVYAFTQIGKVVTSIYNEGSFSPVGTVMSAVDYDFINQTLSYSTDFFTLDFSSIGRRSYYNTVTGLARRITAVEDATRNIDTRVAGGGGGAGPDLRLAVVTAVGDYRTYTVDIYSNADKDAIAAGETMKVVTGGIDSLDQIDVGSKFFVIKFPHGDPAELYWTPIAIPTWA